MNKLQYSSYNLFNDVTQNFSNIKNRVPEIDYSSLYSSGVYPSNKNCSSQILDNSAVHTKVKGISNRTLLQHPFLKEMDREHTWYPFFLENKQIKVNLNEAEPNENGLIYLFRNKATGRLLVGKSGEIKGRLGNYFSAIKKSNGNNEFCKDFKNNVENFEITILYKLKEGENIDLIEDKFILKYKKRGHSLYNKRRGGGGGNAVKNELPSFYAIPKQGLFDSAVSIPLTTKMTTTSQKIEQIAKDSVLFEEFEKEYEKAKKDENVFGCIYSFIRNPEKMHKFHEIFKGNLNVKRKFLDDDTADMPVRKRRKGNHLENNNCSVAPVSNLEKNNVFIQYIGHSGEFINRSKYHISLGNRALNGKTKGLDKFHKDLGKHLEQFSVSILPVRYLKPSDLSEEQRDQYYFYSKIGEVETKVTQMAREIGKVYNIYDGSNGSRHSKLCRKPHQVPKFKLT